MKNLFVLSKLFLLVILSLCAFEKTYSLSKNQSSKSTTFVYIEPQNIRTFIDELNRLGKLGYRLKTTERYTELTIPENLPDIKIAGLAERIEGNTYEYQWFSAATLPELAEKIDAPAKQGFYFNNLVSYSLRKPVKEPPADATPLEKSMASIKNSLSEDPVDGSAFILERKNNFRDSIEFALAMAKPDTSIFNTETINIRNITETLEASIADVDTRKYQPIAAFFSSNVFKNRVSHLPTVLFQNSWEYNYGGQRPNYKIVEVFQFGSKFREKIDAASSQGYEIVSLGYNLAVMLETGRNVSYQWLKPAEKKFEQTLTSIPGNGARFRMNGIDTQMQNILVFEQFPEFKSQRFEYKTLKVTDKPYRQKKQNERRIITPAEALKEFEALQNQGYRARSLFYRDGMNVLLEKPILER